MSKKQIPSDNKLTSFNNQIRKFKAIVCDVDDTLTVAEEGALPSAPVVEAVRKAQNSGLIFTLATGRPLKYVEVILNVLNIRCPIIVEGGATIYHAGKKKILWQSVIDPTIAEKVLHLLAAEPYSFAVIDNGHRYVDPKVLAEGKVTKIGVYDVPSKEADRLIRTIEDATNLYAVVSSGWRSKNTVYLHITSHNATKQQAILRLANYLGISTKDIIGIGDHYNDFPLLMACGLKVAMGNAVSDLKEIADFVAPSLEEDGVAEVINRFILKKGKR